MGALKRVLIIATVFVALVYAGDYLSVRYRISHNRDPLGVVKIRRYYAVPLKNRKTEFYPLDPEFRQCVHSLFPHLGYSPCWYLNRKKEDRIDM
jgi:hypothetical protein